MTARPLRRLLVAMLVAAAGTIGSLPGAAAESSSDDASAGMPVTVSRVGKDGRRSECRDLVGEDRGGCPTLVRSRGRLDFTIRTLAGPLPFARCLYNYRLAIDGSGRTRIWEQISAGNNPCNDVRPCVNADHTGWLPWHGQIERRASAGYVHTIDACVDTCLGQFKGQLVMDLERHGDVWRATAASEPVGSSGFVFGGGSWDWRVRGLQIRPAGS